MTDFTNYRATADLDSSMNFRKAMDLRMQTTREEKAEGVSSRIFSWIEKFNAGLDDKYEVGLVVTTFGQTHTIHLDAVGYSGPVLVLYLGRTDSGEPAELMQHISQVNVCLVKAIRKNPELPKSPIGFHAETNSKCGDIADDDPLSK